MSHLKRISPSMALVISADDVCVDCTFSLPTEGSMRKCSLGWPGVVDEDLYVRSCPRKERMSKTDTMLRDIIESLNTREEWVPGADVERDGEVSDAVKDFVRLDAALRRGLPLPRAWQPLPPDKAVVLTQDGQVDVVTTVGAQGAGGVS